MKLLMVAYDLPPALQPQAIQIGRLMYHLPPEYQMYVVTADDENIPQDACFYADIGERFTDVLRIPRKRLGLARRAMHKLFPLFFSMPDILVRWQGEAYRRIIGKWGCEKFDAIVTFSYPLSANLLGLWLKRFFRVRWLAFFSDPWVGSPYTKYGFIARRANNRLEKMVVTEADSVVFSSEELRGAYVRKYPMIEGKAFCHEHSFDPDLYEPRKSGKSGRLTLRYLGSLHAIRTAAPLLTAMGALVQKKIVSPGDILFEVYGSVDAVNLRRMRELSERFGLGAVVVIKKAIPYIESLRVMQGADVLVVIDADVPDSVFLPSKLIDYVGSGRPILGITPADSATTRVIRRAGGWAIRPGDVPGIERTIIEVVENYKNGTLDKFKPSDAVREEYSVSANMRRLERLLRGRP